MTTYTFSAIGYMHSPYKEKFAIPRQPGLVTSARGYIELEPEFSQPGVVDGLTDFSHIWVQFAFHQTAAQGWKAKVRPPRLGGNQRIGVFATRSTFRPNPLGLSVIKLEHIECVHGHTRLHLSGFDLLDQTPILDIKPYLAYADALPQAQSAYAGTAPPLMAVRFTPQVSAQLDTEPQFAQFLREVLAQDPRPSYHRQQPSERVYGVRLGNYDVRWQVIANEAVVTHLSDC